LNDTIRTLENMANAVRLRICVLLSLAVICAALPLVVHYRPQDQSIGAWWARFGSVVTVFGLYGQLQINYLAALITPGGLGSLELINAMRKYGPWVRYLTSATLLIIATGTLIWGFGDLLLDAISAPQSH